MNTPVDGYLGSELLSCHSEQVTTSTLTCEIQDLSEEER